MSAWTPTRKWLTAAVTAVLTIVAHAIASDGWDQTEWGELVAVAIPLAAAYLMPNTARDGAHAMAYAQRKNKP